jgi:thymidylate synthase (FAD)
MKIVEQSITPLKEIDGEEILWTIEAACRLCYKSEGKNLEKDPHKRDTLIRAAVRRGHTSVLEHASVTFRVITNRGVSHEWVRHRIGCSYSQESTRYCNYGDERFGNEITVIWPWWLGTMPEDPKVIGKISWEEIPGISYSEFSPSHFLWYRAMESAEKTYLQLLKYGKKAEEARGILPNDLKTEFIVTMNPVSLRHFLRLRCSLEAHFQIRSLALQALALLHEKIPIIFDDLYEKHYPPSPTIALDPQS